MKECDISRVKTYSDPSYTFPGGQDPGAVLRWSQGAQAPSLWLSQIFEGFPVFVTDKDFKLT